MIARRRIARVVALCAVAMAVPVAVLAQPAGPEGLRPLHDPIPKALYVEGPGHARDDGSVEFVGQDRTIRYWPAANRVVETPLPLTLPPGAASVFAPEGLWSLGGEAAPARDVPVRVTTAAADVSLVRPDGTVVRGALGVARFRATAVPLSGGGVLVVGGRVRRSLREVAQPGEDLRSAAAEIVRLRDGRIEATRVADLPGPGRWGVALVPLRDGRVFAAGGAATFYRSCLLTGCTADAWVFDPRTGRWEATAPMSLPRTDFTATRLPDGRVLVVGGWTNDVQDGVAHAEVWDPATGRWTPIAPAPAVTAQHDAAWLPGEAGRTLLIGAGTNSQLQALDVPTMRWRTVGHADRYRVGGTVLPWRDAQGRAWATVFGGAPSPRGQDRGPSYDLERIALAEPQPPAASPAAAGSTPAGVSNTLRAWPRVGAASAIDPQGRVLIAGGTVDADPGWVATASAELTSTDNAPLRALPAMTHRRSGAQALWLHDGDALVIGGFDQGYGDRAKVPAPPEWYDARAGRWRALVDAGTGGAFAVPPGSVAATLPGQGALLIGGNTAERLAIADGRVRRSAMPDLSIDHRGAFVARAFADGRVVIAGGERGAFLIETAEQPGRYRGHGPSLPAERHERFDPAVGRWIVSADADIGLRHAAVLDDGSVAGIGEQTAAKQENDRWTAPVLGARLSTPDGSAWRTIPLPDSLVHDLDGLRLSVQRGELYLQGAMTAPEGQSRPRALWWLDRETMQWQRLAQWPPHLQRLRAVPARRPADASVLVGLD